MQAKVAGRPISGQLRIVVPSAAPLVGTWRQESIVCTSDSSSGLDSIHSSRKSAVRELVIRGDNTFSVTWLQPFEAYYDYWGDYRWDPERGEVEFTAKDGNRLPRVFDGSGVVRRDGDRLVFTGVDFGEPEISLPARGCTVTFN